MISYAHPTLQHVGRVVVSEKRGRVYANHLLSVDNFNAVVALDDIGCELV